MRVSPRGFRNAQSFLGWNAREMADNLGITTRAVRQYRSGDRRVSGTAAILLNIYVQSKQALENSETDFENLE